MTVVLGVDGCPGGWCAVAIAVSAEGHRVGEPVVYGRFSDILDSKGEVICVDVPIGLLDIPGRRTCDVAAKALLAERASCVFWPPCRTALPATTHAQATAINKTRTDSGLSIQAFGIMRKIAEVDTVITPRLQERVFEVHPEVSFCVLNGGAPVTSKKNRVAGRIERWKILRGYLPSLADMPPRPSELPPQCQPDDYIDALVAAWTAICIMRDEASCIPDEPETDDRGLRMEMWFPTR